MLTPIPKKRNRVLEAFRRFGEGLILESKEQVLDFVRGFLDGKLEKATPGMFEEAVMKNTPLLPNLKDSWKYKRVFKNLLSNRVGRKLFEEEKESINYYLVMSWLREDRPDLWGVVENWNGPQAKVWLEAQIEQVKKEIMGIE